MRYTLMLSMLAGALMLGGCNAVGEAVDYPPEATEAQAKKMEGVEAGDPLPEGKSNHPIDNAEKAVRRVDRAAGGVLDPMTGGWWSVVLPAVLGGLNVFQGTMRRAEKRDRQNKIKKARRKLEDAGDVQSARELEDEANESA